MRGHSTKLLQGGLQRRSSTPFSPISPLLPVPVHSGCPVFRQGALCARTLALRVRPSPAAATAHLKLPPAAADRKPQPPIESGDVTSDGSPATALRDLELVVTWLPQVRHSCGARPASPSRSCRW